MISDAMLYQKINSLPAIVKEHLLDYIELLLKRNIKIERVPTDLSNEDNKKKIDRIFKEIQELNIFNQVVDPVEWQKEQRDEWENRIAG